MGTTLSLEVVKASGFLKLRVPSPAPKKHQRGQIRGFSPKSRKRLQEKLQVLDHEKMYQGTPVKFLTLTYGTYGPSTEEEAKNHLDIFLKRVVRRCRSASGIWRMEWQKRGVIHFHIMCFNWFNFPKEWIKANWGQAIGCKYWDLSRNEEPFTRIESIRTIRGCASYVSKYISKTDGSKGDQSNPIASAGFNSVPYLTVGGLNDDCYEVFKAVLERAYHNKFNYICAGERFSYTRAEDYLFNTFTILKNGHSLDDMEDFFEYFDECLKLFARDYEKDLLMPKTGRHWGAFNARSLKRKEISSTTYFLPCMGAEFLEMEQQILSEILVKLKVFCKSVQAKLKVNMDEKGFTIFCPENGDENFVESFLEKLIKEAQYTYDDTVTDEFYDSLIGQYELPQKYEDIP